MIDAAPAFTPASLPVGVAMAARLRGAAPELPWSLLAPATGALPPALANDAALLPRLLRARRDDAALAELAAPVVALALLGIERVAREAALQRLPLGQEQARAAFLRVRAAPRPESTVLETAAAVWVALERTPPTDSPRERLCSALAAVAPSALAAALDVVAGERGICVVAINAGHERAALATWWRAELADEAAQ